jgi:hypothetical protein
MLDVRSPLAVKVMDANPHAYRKLVVEGGTPALAHEMLSAIQPEQLLSRPAASPVAAFAMLAGLWLWHDGLDECHKIAQKSPEELHRSALNLHSKASEIYKNGGSVESVENSKAINHSELQQMTSTLAFWHAIMHRREGDFSNSKYWYARAAGHPALATIAGSVGPLVNRAPADKSLLRMIASGWNPNAFVDFVESVSADEADARYPIAVQLQQLEWRVLWEHCAREA